MTALNKKALVGLLGLFAAMTALLFLPAWTLGYWQAWAFLAMFFAAALLITINLMKKIRGFSSVDPCRSDRRKGEEPKDNPINHGSRICVDACRSRI